MNNLMLLGKKGEMLLLRKLISIGWSPSDVRSETDLKNVDLVVEKNNLRIKIQVKSSELHNGGRYHYERDELGYLKVNWNFLVFTNLINFYIYPYEFMKRKCPNGFSRRKYHDRVFMNKFELLEMDETHIMYYLMEYNLQNQ